MGHKGSIQHSSEQPFQNRNESLNLNWEGDNNAVRGGGLDQRVLAEPGCRVCSEEHLPPAPLI